MTEHAPEAGPLGVLATFRQTPPAVKAILAGVFVGRLAGFLVIFMVVFLTHRGFTTGQAGFALGVYGAGAVVGSFVGGWATDRLSARSATAISMLGTPVLIISILYIKAFPLIVLAVFLVGAVGQLYRPAAQFLITELTPPSQLVMVTAMQRLAMNLGTTVTPLIGTALLSVSYSLLFWAEAIASVAYGLIALKALPPKMKPTPGETPVVQPRAGYRAVMSDWRYLFFLAAVFFVAVVYAQYTAALPLAIVSAGLSLWWYSAVVSLNAFIVATCEVLATKWVQTWPMRVTALSGFGLVAVGYTVHAFGITPALLILGTILWTASEITGAPTTFAYPGMVAPVHLRGRYIGAMQTVFGLATAVGPVAGIALWAAVGNRMFAWAAAVAALSTLCALIGMRLPGSTPATVKEPVAEPAS
ncbi:MAG TPA: MFS transporter [Jatrophihabitans sp.]|jgi:MFS family permease|uniref:MFS transporter n=1 Tax=Jatrophihabitans sp. TaxID=1932789 RepID=UPI002F14B1EE